jgi:regulator of sigma E protease
MSFAAALQNLDGLAVLYNFAAFVVALIVIVFVHEFGHFIVGRWCGVKAEVFSVGFGKELFGYTDKHGTRWKFCPIPLGGYVKFEGDANAASMPAIAEGTKHSPTSLHGQPVWERMAVVAAGPLANFILAIFIFMGFFMFLGLPYERPLVTHVVPGSAAEAAGIVTGDLFVEIDGAKIQSYRDVQEAVFLRPDETFNIVVLRGEKNLSLSITPRVNEEKDGFGGTIKTGRLGVEHKPQADEPLFRQFSPVAAFVKSTERVWFVISTTGKMVGKIITGQQSAKQIGGAISIGKGAGDAASGGPLTFLEFLAFFSISIGLINLLPIPMLDGGHLVFYAIEAVRGKPLGRVAQEWGYRIGLSCVLMLMVFGLFNDAGRSINVLFGT